MMTPLMPIDAATNADQTDTLVSLGHGTDRMPALARLFPDCFEGTVLDVGCRSRALAPYARGGYVGLDLGGSPDVVASLESPLPFRDDAFRSVVALDVLEHVDKIHVAFDELCRVSSRYVVIALPNAYEWRFRLGFLLGRPLSGKYVLGPDPADDRHRWLFTLKEAGEFVRGRASRNGFSVVRELNVPHVYRRPTARWFNRLAAKWGPRGTSLVTDHYWVVLSRDA